MMKQLTLIVLLVTLLANLSNAQQAVVTGSVRDTAEKKNLSKSVVALLAKDSTFITFTRTDAEGRFSLKDVKPGSYLLLVTHPTFADYYKHTELKAGQEMDLGPLPMTLRSQLLQEVVVRQQLGAIRQKKDTTEYVADSFKVDANASVEDLLKRLPGVEVDKDGKIKAQGETVQKVLVDGEEFFGDDPTMATQNLRADAVDKVQVFDKKSDQAAFTGIDDGVKTKTINLKLKEDKKNGFFGKVSAGGGLKDKFNNQAMINAFKGKRKFAAYGVMSNTGRTGLGWGDQSTYGGGESGSMEIMEGGMIMITSEGDDFGGGGSYWGEGLPTSWSAGLHYSNKYDEDKHKLNFNYKFNKLNTASNGFTTSQYLLPDTFYFRNENGSTFSQRLRNSLGGNYEVQLDSSSSLKLTLNGNMGKTQNRSFNHSETLSAERDLVNQSNRSSSADGDNQAFNSSLIWRKKFRKVGRTISVNFDQKYTNSATTGYLNSGNYTYNPDGSLKALDTVDQQKINNNNKMSLNGKISYTEPLAKKVFLELNYALGNSNSESERITYDKDNGKYSKYVNALSTDFGFDILTQSAGANIRVNGKKVNFSFGGNVSQSNFKQTDLLQDTVYKYDFVNFFPRANFTWNIKPQTRFYVRYNGSTNQPTIEQLQPLKDNTDLFNIQKGNPNLRQEFRHNFSMNFNDFKVLNNRGIWAAADFTFTQNAIANSDSIYNDGRRVSMPDNVNGNYSYYAYGSYFIKIKKTDFNLNFDANISGNRYSSIVNGVKNTTTSGSYTLGIGGNYRKEKKVEFNYNIRQTYNKSQSSINASLNTNYWSTSTNGGVTVYIKKKTLIATNAEVTLRQKTTLFTANRNVTLWNASISHKIFKGETGLVKFEIRDLLNKNIGLDRNISSNLISERSYLTLRRFWLLTFTWNFSKNGKAPSSPFGDEF